MTTQSRLITELMTALRRVGSGYHIRCGHLGKWLDCLVATCVEDLSVYLKAYQICSCKPGSPDDQCSIHGYEAWKQQRLEDCPHCNGDPDGVCYHQKEGGCIEIEDVPAVAEEMTKGHRYG
ncbi:hypothetical protein LCGC14_0442850 [marine sediment metagenome]|uniref:Uncharacterized protein n=1 Tax=marine sediment metagenome TaxID=412755 RepID=A0A0F9SK06_9ZZZZ